MRILESISQRTLLLASIAVVGAATIVCTAAAQKVVPIPSPLGNQRPAEPPLPPPLTRTEQRFRELATYIRQRGAIDAATAATIEQLAKEIDAELASPQTDRDQMLRLLPARAQIAIWMTDEKSMDAAFEKLMSFSTASEAIAIAWARETNNDARFEKTLEILMARSFTSDPRRIDAKILIGDALRGLNRFDAAQAEYNTAPFQGRSNEQLAAIGEGTRRVSAGRDLFNRELVMLQKDQVRGDLPVVELTTTKGAILVELFEDYAPSTVGNFIEHCEAMRYDGTAFHRFMRGFGVQGGDPETAAGREGGMSNGGWVIPDECDRPDRRSPLVGRLVMAKQPASDSPIKPAANSAGCQFTILTGPAEGLDGYYTVFGRVIDGMEHARALREGDQIVRATVISKRNHDYKAVRLGEGTKAAYSLPRPGIPLSPAQTGEASADPAIKQASEEARKPGGTGPRLVPGPAVK